MLSADLAVDNSWCCRLHLLVKLHTTAIISVDFAQTDIWSHQVLGAQTLHWIPLWTMVWAASFTNKTQTRNPSGCQPFLIYPIPALFPSLTCLSFTVALLCLVSRYHPRISFIKKSPYLDTAHFFASCLQHPRRLYSSHTPQCQLQTIALQLMCKSLSTWGNMTATF